MKNTEIKQIECPNCKTPINVNDLLYHQLQEQVQQEYGTKFATLEMEKAGITSAIEEGVTKQLAVKKTELEHKIKTQVKAETSEEILSYQRQLEEKTGEVRQMNLLKSELSETKRKFDGLKEQVEAESQEKFSLLLMEEKTKIRSLVEKNMELKFSEKDQVIESMKGQINEMQRKIEQGSMQVQGEAQELLIEDFLKVSFPLDSINEVKKGARGADCVQIVNTMSRLNCGSIVYESKRTQSFQPAWTEKFKEDMRAENATIGVLVTSVMPKDMAHMGQKDGIWICTFQEFKGLCHVLREAVILYSTALTSQENKGEKMEMLYEYLTSSEFRMQIEAIVEAFTQMHTDLASEKRSLEMIWKRREKQLQKVLQNTIHMHGSIRGIAGNAIGTIKALELPAHEEDAA